MQNIFVPILLILAVTGCKAEAEKTDSPLPAAKLASKTLASETLASETLASNKPEIKTKFEAKNNLEIKQEAPKMITLRGTVRYKNFEGGFWGLDGNDGNKYMPAGLNKALLVDGMIVEVTGIIEEDKNLMTFQQYGKILTVKGSKMIDNSKTKTPNSY